MLILMSSDMHLPRIICSPLSFGMVYAWAWCLALMVRPTILLCPLFSLSILAFLCNTLSNVFRCILLHIQRHITPWLTPIGTCAKLHTLCLNVGLHQVIAEALTLDEVTHTIIFETYPGKYIHRYLAYLREKETHALQTPWQQTRSRVRRYLAR